MVGEPPLIAQAIRRMTEKVTACLSVQVLHRELVLGSRCGHSGDACGAILQQEVEHTYLEVSPHIPGPIRTGLYAFRGHCCIHDFPDMNGRVPE